MWAVPMFVLATWWSMRLVSSTNINLSLAMKMWWIVGSIAAFGVLTIPTLAYADIPTTSVVWAAWGVTAGVIGPLLAIDVATRRLPRQLSLPVFAIAVIVLTLEDGPAGRSGPIIGAVVMTAITVILRFLSKGSLGLGDVLVSPLLGAALGWFEPLSVVVAWVMTAVLGGVMALAGLARTRNREAVIAYGPALFAGTAVALLRLAW